MRELQPKVVDRTCQLAALAASIVRLAFNSLYCTCTVLYTKPWCSSLRNSLCHSCCFSQACFPVRGPPSLIPQLTFSACFPSASLPPHASVRVVSPRPLVCGPCFSLSVVASISSSAVPLCLLH